MDIVPEFTRKFGGSWIKVGFYRGLPEGMEPAKMGPLTFCDALEKSRTTSILLEKNDIRCLGGRYIFGEDPDIHSEAIDVCHSRRGIPKDEIELVLKTIPSLKDTNFVGLNLNGPPDMLISYAQPEGIMHILDRHNRYGDIVISHLGIGGVCGNVIAPSYRKKKITLFFGCEGIRSARLLTRDKAVIGVPEKFFDILLG